MYRMRRMIAVPRERIRMLLRESTAVMILVS